MKKLGLAILVLALVITVAYVLIGVLTFEASPVELTKVGIADKEAIYKAELIYNGLAYADGSYEYSVQAYVNIEEIIKGVTPAEQATRTASAKNAIAQIKARWEQNGYEIVETRDDFVYAIIVTYEDAEDMSLANGETGYMIYQSSGTAYKGWFYTDTVVERETAYKATEGTVLNSAEEYLSKIGGMNAGEISLVFNYGTPYKPSSIGSTADSIFQYTNEETYKTCYIHEFRLTNETRGDLITLVQHNPNSITWYLIAIVGAMLVCGITLISVDGKRSK
ncbi:MAG: hypothetical protein J6R35_02315 [Clostridia bacterium]|nr:hypothetical protein [Clostridia bacterium]